MITNTRKKIGIAGVVAAFIGFGIYYYVDTAKSGIFPYNAVRDKEAIIKLFEANYYWLTPNEGTSMKFLLDYKTPNRNPLFFGRMSIDVLREKDTFVGFTTYYKESAQVGRILFLAVDEKMRGKRYGQQLIEHAIAQSIKMGSRKIILLTRLSNTGARKLYERVGFTEVQQYNGFIDYEYIPSV